MADTKLTGLAAFTPEATDLLYGVDDPGGTPVSGQFTVSALLSQTSWNQLQDKPSEFTPAAHNQAWGTITGTPTTVSGYGITDAASEDAVETAAVNAQTGTAYTLALTDRGQVVTMDNASANTVTVPTNGTVAFDIGSVVNIVQIGAGVTTITGATGVTVNGTSGGSISISAQYQGASLLQVATDVWIASGAI